jgi:hypothetical protein
VIDLGTAAPTYGTDSAGNGIVTGSNGLTYIFNTLQGGSPSPSSNTSQPLPIVMPAPVGNDDTYGNPAYAYSQSTLWGMNNQGLAVGLDQWGVAGHIGDTTAFVTQLQADGSWGPPSALWSGIPGFGGSGGMGGLGILGITPNGQVLGYGYNMQQPLGYDATPTGYGLILYDSKSQSYTNLSSLIDSTMSSSQTNWFLNSPFGRIDDQGRILLSQEVYESFSGPLHTLLLIPDGVSSDPIATPEPATWVIFATLIGGWMSRKRLRSCPLSVTRFPELDSGQESRLEMSIFRRPVRLFTKKW